MIQSSRRAAPIDCVISLHNLHATGKSIFANSRQLTVAASLALIFGCFPGFHLLSQRQLLGFARLQSPIHPAQSAFCTAARSFTAPFPLLFPLRSALANPLAPSVTSSFLTLFFLLPRPRSCRKNTLCPSFVFFTHQSVVVRRPVARSHFPLPAPKQKKIQRRGENLHSLHLLCSLQ